VAEKGDSAVHVIVPRQWKYSDSWIEKAENSPIEGDEHVTFTSVLLSGNGTLFVLNPLQLTRVMQCFKPDIIDVDEEPWSLCALEIDILRRLVCPDARLVFETSQNMRKTYPLPFSLIQRYIFSSADGAIAISSEALNVLRANGFNKPAKVIGHGVDCNYFRKLEVPIFRNALVGDDEFVIGYAGAIAERKGILTLVEAFSRLGSSRCVLLLVGNGPADDKVEAWAHLMQEGQGRIVKIDVVAHTDMPKYLNIMDVLVLPSLTTVNWKEQFGRVLVEAMACEVAVVGSSSGGIPETIGKAGLVFKEGNAGELASLLTQLSLSVVQCRELGAKGRKRVQENYSLETVAVQRIGLYEELIA
jgi:glycosyltransferase involved in cell wall biosynthesis